MQPETRTRRRWVYVVLFWLAFVLGLAAWRSQLKPPPEAWMLNLTNNPNKFFLWVTDTNINHVFNYDPHAADEWRFENGYVLTVPPRTSAAPMFLNVKQGQ